MATNVPDALYGIYKLIDPYFKTNKIGGVANPGSPGYHTSREDLLKQGRSGDYSIQCPADKRGNAKNAAGIDITFGDVKELITLHQRLRAACTPNVSGEYDPRIECVREIIGTLDGKYVSGYNRVATGSGGRSRVGWVTSGYSDSSHLWHEHVSVLRDRVDNVNEMAGLAEVMAGVTPGTFGWKSGDEAEPVTPVEPTPVPPKTQDYTVVKGDTLSAIAKRFGLSGWQAIAALNEGINPQNIKVGQAIKLPADAVESKPEPKPEPEPEPKPVDVVWMNSNIMRDDDTRSKFSGRAGNLAAFYVASKASLFTWQEVDPHITDESPLMTVVTKMGSKYRYDRGGPNACGWNDEVWEFKSDQSFTKKLSHVDGTGVRYLHVIRLEHRDSGKGIWLASVHLNHKTTAAASSNRSKQAREVVGYLKPLIAKGDPVFLGGDFNDSGTTSGEPKGVLKAGGLKLMSEQSKVGGRTIESHHGLAKPSVNSKWIDDQCFANAAYVTGKGVDTYAKRLSDHNAQLGTYKI